MDTSLRLTSETSNGRGPTAMSIGLSPSFITWPLPSLFLSIDPSRSSFVFFFQTSVCNHLFYAFVFVSISPLHLELRFSHARKKKSDYQCRFQNFTKTIFEL